MLNCEPRARAGDNEAVLCVYKQVSSGMRLRGQKNDMKVESGPLPLGGSSTSSVVRTTFLDVLL